MEIQWTDSRTVGSISMSGNTAYTLGQAGGGVESILFADQSDGLANINVLFGVGGHVFNSRLDLWSDLSAVNNTTGPVTFNGGIIGEARPVAAGYTGGQLQLSGSGKFIINGNAYYQRSTLLTGGVTLQLNGTLYADSNFLPETVVQVSSASTLITNSFDSALGGLPFDASRVVVDGGTLRTTASGTFSRGFSIGPGGATIDVPLGVALNLASGAQAISSSSGGTLTLSGGGAGQFQSSLAGSGQLVKSGTGSWTLKLGNSYSGDTVVQQGLLTIEGTTGTGDTTIQSAGSLNGTGNVLGNLTADGSISPGESIGTLNVLGDYVQHASGTLVIELQGTATGEYDVLNVTGSAQLDGGLTIALLGGFTPSPGDRFAIINAADVTGTLALHGDSTGFSLLSTISGLSLYYGILLPGDYDHNDVVDAADYVVWRRPTALKSTTTYRAPTSAKSPAAAWVPV